MVNQFYTLKKNEKILPHLPIDEEEAIRKICLKGMKKKQLEGKQEYEDRLEEELDLITRKGFSVYFLILWDAIKWCRDNAILIGAGRGSAAGSLVSYLMEITDVDPIEYDLLFFRFLSEWRAEYPDIDTDIADRDRPRLKKYLEDKYGREKVASVTTFIYFSPKSAIKAACRVLAVPYKESNDVVSGVETFEDFKSTRYKEFHQKYKGVYKLAKSLDGRLSAVGFHAAATVITEHPITDYSSVESRKTEGDESRQPVISLPKEDAEELGFIKYDFLGLKTLTVVADSLRYIKENHGKLIDIRNLSFDDPLVLKMISDGHTSGLFQAEATASTKIIKEMGIESFADLVASNALVRPGAWKVMGTDYIAKKKGYKSVEYLPGTERFLAETYGDVLYQEQTMLLCTELAGLTREESDKIRKLTARKKSKEELLPFKEKFVNGASEKVSTAKAEKLWNDIETTAEYQFNKCLAKDTRVFVREKLYDSDGDFDGYDEFETTVDRLMNGSEDFEILGPEHVKQGNTGGEKWYKVKGVYNNGVKDIVRVWINEDWYIDSTFDHRHRLSKGWREAHRIHQMDRICTDKGTQNVWKVTWEGQADTYDIELYDEPHAFYANGFVTHNSHSVAYSQLTYITALLKYYYPAEFMAATLNNEKDSSSVAEYLAECNRLGIEVKTPDVNKSDLDYSVSGGVIYMGLSKVKYISDTLAQRLIAKRPFKSYEDFKSKVLEKGSGLNIRVIDSLNKIGATRFHDHVINESECKQYYYEYLGIATLDNALITPTMKNRLLSLSESEDKPTGICYGTVTDIVSKNGWHRADLVDDTGTGGFFVDQNHGLEKGKSYLFALAKGSVVGCVDMDDLNTRHPIVRFLKGDFREGTYNIAAKARKTKTGNEMATMLYSYDGKLNSCTIWSDKIAMARRFKLGTKVRLKVQENKRYGASLVLMVKDERE